MGILGLTTFVNCNPWLTEEFPLHSTRIVIDGNSLYHFIYEEKYLDFYHGGDYDQYAIEITEFFRLLHSCNIELYVVFDGGNDPKDMKFQTLQERMKQKLKTPSELLIDFGAEKELCQFWHSILLKQF